MTYNKKVLISNWCEDQYDESFSETRPRLMSDVERNWQTTYQSQTFHGLISNERKPSDMDNEFLSEKEHNVRRYSNMKKKEKKEGFEFKSFPGHQPALDPDAETNKKEQFSTTTGKTFVKPSEQQRTKHLGSPKKWTPEKLDTYRQRWSKTSSKDKLRHTSTAKDTFREHKFNLY